MKVKDIAKTRCILTFGYGNRKDYDAFLEYLQKFDVECVVDVRMVGSIHFWKIYKFCENIRTDKIVCITNYESG